jgi:hypothetical protein
MVLQSLLYQLVLVALLSPVPQRLQKPHFHLQLSPLLSFLTGVHMAAS